MKGSQLAALVVAAAGPLLAPPPAPCATNVAVFNFQMTSDTPEWKWLEKGLADRIITDFHIERSLDVIKRDAMQDLAAKMEWVPEMMADTGRMGMVRNTLRIKYVASGVFQVTGEKISITGTAVQVKTGEERGRCTVSGKAAEALELTRRLSADMVALFTGKTSQEVLKALPVWTKSIPAARALYEGMDLYDQGRYGEAWVKFRQASREDPDYLEATYWVGKMYYFMDRYEHARRAFEQFVYLDSAHPRVGDAVMEFLHTYEKLDTPQEALLALYKDFNRRFPEVPGFLWDGGRVPWWSGAWFGQKTGLLLEQMGRYREAVLLSAGPGRPDLPGDYNCDLALRRHNALTGETFAPKELPRLGWGSTLFKVVHFKPGETEAVSRIIWQTLGGAVKEYPYTVEHYGIIAPSGSVFTTMRLHPKIAVERGTVEVDLAKDVNASSHGTGDVAQRTVSIAEAKTQGIPFGNLPRGGLFEVMVKVTPDAPVKDEKLLLDGLRVRATFDRPRRFGAIDVSCSNTEHFRVDVDGRPGRRGPGLIGLLPAGPRTLRFYPDGPSALHGEATARVLVKTGETIRFVGTLPWRQDTPWSSWTDGVLVGSCYDGHDLALARRFQGVPAVQMDNEAIRLVWSRGGDLWSSMSTDGQTFSTPARLPLPVSTAWLEGEPRLLRDESGRFMVVFKSDRNPQHVYRPFACWSRDFVHWSAPAEVADEVGMPIRHLIQDGRGRFVIAYSKAEGNGGEVRTLVSRDGFRWEPLGRVDVTSPGECINGLAIHVRHDDTYELFCATRPKDRWREVFEKPPEPVGPLRRFTSTDGVTWSKEEKLSTLKGRSIYLSPMQRDGRTILCVCVAPQARMRSRLFLIREMPDGSWQRSPWYSGVTHDLDAMAWHPKWGFVLASMASWKGWENQANEWGPYLIRSTDIDPLFAGATKAEGEPE